MNCCDDYGNCNQGRDCPIRKKREHDCKLSKQLDMGVDDEVDLSFTPVIVVLLCVVIIGLSIIWGSR